MVEMANQWIPSQSNIDCKAEPMVHECHLSQAATCWQWGMPDLDHKNEQSSLACHALFGVQLERKSNIGWCDGQVCTKLVGSGEYIGLLRTMFTSGLVARAVIYEWIVG